MKYLSMAALAFSLSTVAHATSIESVSLHADDGGEAGEAVEMFTPTQRNQHFSVQLDELKLGNHSFLIEFWAEETVAAQNQKLTEFETSGLIANVITANVSLPTDWPMGRYRIDVKMDGKPLGSHRYIVSKPWAQQKINAWTLYQDDGKGGEGPEVEAFRSNDRVQHFEMQTDGYLQRGARIKIIYAGMDASSGAAQQIKTVDFTVPDDSKVFNILTSYISLESDWEAGNYEITVFDGKRLLGKHRYQIK